MNARQKEVALLWIKQYVSLSLIVPVFAVLLIITCLVVIAITTRLGLDLNKTVIAMCLGIVILVPCFLLIRNEISKIKAIKSGAALITEVTVISKGLTRVSSRSSSYCVRVKGLYENNKPVEKDIIVTRRLYKSVVPNDKGYAIRFDPADNNTLPKDLGYIPG